MEFISYLCVVFLIASPCIILLLAFMLLPIILFRKTKETQPPKLSKKVHSNRNDISAHLQEYYDAVDQHDFDKAQQALIENAKNCPNRNSYCLTQVFCPDCPLTNGGLAVRSGRHGM